MASIDYSDLRLYARFDLVECAVVYSESNPEPYRATLVDIGLGGVQLRSKEPMPVEEKLSLHLGQDAQEPLKICGIARYSKLDEKDGMYVTGFKFTPESHQERVAIAEFVHGVFQRQWEILAS